MSVLCVESGIVYADLIAAVAAEGGADKTFEVDGVASGDVNVGAAQYSQGFEVRPTAGQEVSPDGDINQGALIDGRLTMASPGGKVLNIRAKNVNIGTATGGIIDGCIVNANFESDAVGFNDSSIITNTIVCNGGNDGVISNAIRPNSLIQNVTVIDCERFGYANGKYNDSVGIETGNSVFFSSQTGSANNHSDDGSGGSTNDTTTADLVDYAGGKYGLKADSAAAIAGAGAFIQTAGSGHALDANGSTVIPTGLAQLNYELTAFSILATGEAPLSSGSANLNYSIIDFSFSAEGDAPSATGSATLSYDAQGFNLLASGEAKVPLGSAVLSYSLQAFSLSGSGQSTTPTGAAELNYAVIEYGLTATGGSPIATGSASLYNGIIDIVVGEDNKLYYTAASRSLTYIAKSRQL